MEKREKDSVRGSFTVEASLVASFILVVLFFTLRMIFILTDTVRMEAVLAEGSIRIDEEMEEDGSWMEAAGGFFSLSSANVRTEVDSSKISASISQTSWTVLPGKKVSVSVEYRKTRQRPVTFVRQVGIWYSALSREE